MILIDFYKILLDGSHLSDNSAITVQQNLRKINKYQLSKSPKLWSAVEIMKTPINLLEKSLQIVDDISPHVP